MGGGKCQARVPSPQSLPVGGLHPWSLGSLGPGPQWAFSRSPGHRLLRGWPHSPYPAGPPASLACLSPDQPWRLGRGLRGFARRPRDCALLKRQYRLPEQGFSVLGSAGALCEGGHSLCPRPDGFPRCPRPSLRSGLPRPPAETGGGGVGGQGSHPRAAAPVGVFSRGTTRISGSLSCGPWGAPCLCLPSLGTWGAEPR